MMSDLRESGCLTGDAQIQDAVTGKIYTIKELAERKEQIPIYVHAVDGQLKIGKHKMIKAFYSGKKTVYELKTRTGRSIKASSNHPFLKLNGWTALEKLKAGDRIAIPRELSINESKQNHSLDEYAFLAHLIGDGCILPKQPYHYTSADQENLALVGHLAHELFGISSRYVKQKNWMHVYFPSPYPLTKGRHHPITHWFNKLGVERVGSYEKELPKSFFESSKQEIAHFLHHLWATDGNISDKNLRGRSPSAAIYYASSSKILASQVQGLLLRLGIQSTLTSTKSSRYRVMHHVNIQGTPNQIRFLECVGCAGKRGHNIPGLLTKLRKINTNPNQDVIPKEAWQLFVEPAKNKKELGWRGVCNGIQTAYCGSTLFKSGISPERMHSLYQLLSDQKLLELAQSDIFWDEIISIQELGLEDVYDATVEDVHNFVANDIIVHNSIEQDADIVVFLLRREYYDPNDKPGMAEIIVGKNRHGGVGSVNLTFVKELVAF